jgi:PAS domain S-box-containing protein
MHREIETTYRQMFLGNPIPMMILDTQTLGFLTVNDAAVDQYGYSREEFLALTALDIRPQEEIEAATKRIHERRPGLDRVGVWKHQKKDGTVIDVEITVHDMEFDGHSARLVMCTDVTDRVVAQEALHESEEKYRTLFTSMLDGFAYHKILLDEDGHPVDYLFLEVNDAFEQLTGLKRSDIIGKTATEIIPDRGGSEFDWIGTYGRVALTGEVVKFDQYSNHLGKWYAVSATSPKEGYFVTIFNDVTALKESEKRFRSAFHLSPDIMAITRVSDSVLVDVNDTFVRISGFNKDEVIGRSSLDLKIWVHPERRGELNDLLKETDAIENTEAQFRKKDGTIFSGLTSWQVVTFENEPHLLSVVKDITELKEAENRLKESEERFRTVFELNPDVVAITKVDDGSFVDVNDAFFQATGYGRGEVIGRSILDFDIWPGPEARDEFVSNITENGFIHNSECQLNNKDGIKIDALLSSRVINFNDESHLLTIVKDVTEQKRAQQRVNESEELFRTAFHLNPDPAAITTIKKGIIVNINEAFSRVLGFKGDEVVGQSTQDLGIWADSNERAKVLDMLDKDGHVDNFETLIQTKTGNTIDGLFSSRIVQIREEEYMLSIFRDVTEQKKAQENIRKSLNEKEILLREIHHRVKNNMQVVSSLLRLQAQQVDDEFVHEMFEKSQSRIRSMSLVHEQLYQSEDFIHISFQDYLEKLVNNMADTYVGDTRQIAVTVNAQDLELSIDSSIPCGLIVSELVSNAYKHAFPSGRHGTISIKADKDAEDMINLRIEDNGTGIPKNVDLEKTKSLGLKLVYMLAEHQLFGIVKIDRKKGTRFHIRFKDSGLVEAA